MSDKINNIISTIFAEMESDLENDSRELLCFYEECEDAERRVIDNVLMYLCGWTFPTILKKCGIRTTKEGNPISSA